MTASILILGASGRAAAFSARRVGFAPVVADLFADADLAAAGIPAERVEDYPAGLARAANHAPPGPWLYTGALGNYPRLVERISQRRELWGNGQAMLKAVRDPVQVAQVFQEAGVLHPAVAAGAERRQLPRDGTWLAKPLRGAAGQGICVWEEQATIPGDLEALGDAYYFQQKLTGVPCSAVFVGHAKGALLLGATEQLIGTPWCGGRSFGYCGSLGPLVLGAPERIAWQGMGDCLVQRFGLRGLFGIDAVVNAAGLWPVEVNPRYTASVELLERAAAKDKPLQAIALHVAACRGELVAAREPVMAENGEWHGKAILFASEDCVVDARFTEEALAMRDSAGWPLVADIPHPGSTVLAGQPVCTVFARAESREATLAALQTRQAELRERLSLVVAG